MGKNEEVEFLKSVPIFSGLAHEQVVMVHGLMETRKVSSGLTIFKEGDEGKEMFVIYEGTVDISQSLTLRLSKSDFASRDKTLSKVSSDNHAFFGEMALLLKDTRTATATAATSCTVGVIDQEDLYRLGEEHPEIAHKILLNISKVLCSRLRKANEDVLKLTTALSVALSR